METVKHPPKVQVFVTEGIRDALKEAAYLERTNVQQLVRTWLLEKLRAYPKGAQLQLSEEG